MAVTAEGDTAAPSPATPATLASRGAEAKPQPTPHPRQLQLVRFTRSSLSSTRALLIKGIAVAVGGWDVQPQERSMCAPRVESLDDCM